MATDYGWLSRIPATIQVEGVDQTPASTINFEGATAASAGGVLTLTVTGETVASSAIAALATSPKVAVMGMLRRKPLRRRMSRVPVS